jgi:hypothetical protein
MQIIVDGVPDNSTGDILLESMKVEYMQELDSCQSTSEYPIGIQCLTIETDNAGGGKFLRIHTGEAGWSINDIEELVNILKDFRKRCSL